MKTMICAKCHDYGRPAKKKRGSDGIAIAAWFVFPIGLPYTLWRMSTKKSVCRNCGSADLVDSESMVGQRLMATIIGEVPKDEGPQLMSQQAEIVQEMDENQMDLLSHVPMVEAPKIPVIDDEEGGGEAAQTSESVKHKDPNVW